MKLFNFKTIFAFAAGCAALCSAACSDDDGIDNRERDYGYIQFKIYKEASYPGAPASQSRAVVDELDYLHTARKLSVELRSGNTSIVQTMVLSAADNQSAEFGLRSDKLQLLAGEYQIVSFSLYDVDDEEIYRGTPDHSNNNNIVNIVAGGLTVHDLTANVAPRGKVRFNLIKDISQLTGEWKSRASSRTREYTFDEIAYFDVTVHKVNSDEQEITFTYLESTFSIHFDEEDRESDDFGYQTSSITCDSLLSLPAATYEITGFVTYDSNKLVLESHTGEEFPDPRSLLTTLNPKGLLQEYSQRRWGTTPEYQVLHTSGPEHLPIYDVEVHLHGYIATGRAASRKHAESEAAKSLYHFLVNQEKCR